MKKNNNPLVSVIIPCYNYARYVGRAISSILDQNQNCEIIIVDNDSTDNLKEVLTNYPTVKYFHQQNQGVCAARNNGLDNSSGEFVIFLDADDWLLPGSLVANINVLLEDKDCALVAGAHIVTTTESTEGLLPNKIDVKDPFCALLKTNFIAMLGAVMFRSDVVKEFYFDKSFTGVEDYDLFFKIAQKYKICHHNTPVAAYFIHGNNYSNKDFVMLDQLLRLFKKQEPFAKTIDQCKALKRGKELAKELYSKRAFLNIERNITDSYSIENIKNLAAIKKVFPIWYYHLKCKYPRAVNRLIINAYNHLTPDEKKSLDKRFSLFSKECQITPQLKAYFVYIAQCLNLKN